jgi:hypothetical protein
MKKKLITAFLYVVFCLAGLRSSAQIACHDAFTLKARLAHGKWADDDAVVRTILAKYLRSNEDIKSQFIDHNPFTRDYFPAISSLSSTEAQPFSLPDPGALDISGVADGLVSFLVKRTKQELSVSFFEKFNTLIRKPEYRDARLLFPRTYATLSVIGDELYNYQAYLNSLKIAFEQDMNGLLPGLRNVIKNGRYSAFFAANPELRATCLSAVYLGNGLLNKQHPGSIIAGYDTTLLHGLHSRNAAGGILTLQLFSNSLRSATGGPYWISRDSLNLLTGDPTTLQIYLGLVYQNAEGITYDDGKTLQGLMNTAYGHAMELQKIVAYMRDFLTQAELVSTRLKSLTGPHPAEPPFSDYYAYYDAALDLVQYAVNFYQLPGLGLSYKPDDRFQAFINAARSGGLLALDISRKNYSAALLNACAIYGFALEPYIAGINAVIRDAHATREQIAGARLALTQVQDLRRYLLRYGSFMAAVSQAQGAGDIEAAIEAAALPSGSSAVKRETRFNVALNAYTGLYFGAEKIHDLDTRFTGSGGLSAPVGISVSMGNRRFFWLGSDARKNWSYSVFLSLIDVGALASYRFTENRRNVGGTDTVTAAQVPAIQLKNIISPGVFFSLGIPKTPLSLSAGWQAGPNLRSISASGSNAAKLEGSYANKLYTRWSVALLVDIPLLNLYTKSK